MTTETESPAIEITAADAPAAVVVEAATPASPTAEAEPSPATEEAAAAAVTDDEEAVPDVHADAGAAADTDAPAQGKEEEHNDETPAAEQTAMPAAADTETPTKAESTDDGGLEALSELVPDLKSRKHSLKNGNGMTLLAASEAAGDGADAAAEHVDAEADAPDTKPAATKAKGTNANAEAGTDTGAATNESDGGTPARIPTKSKSFASAHADDMSSSDGDDPDMADKDVDEILYGKDDGLPAADANSDQALDDDSHQSTPRPPNELGNDVGFSGETYNNISSAQSLTTATQTHEIRMPMYLPNFKPATGCTNASDFIVRCFAARLRSGVNVVKHGRSRWCKSRLRVLHIHPDGKSLSWKPAQGEPTSSKRPPKLDLTTCLEVRHAWSPDPQNPMYTGTPILRQKCEAANAHKSFALIFPKRTVDITSVTADQCKVLMEGFSALCFRLQVANFAARGGKEDEAEREAERDTASVTLTNNSNSPLSPNNPARARRSNVAQ